MKYYERILTLDELPGYYFKIKQQPATKIFAMTTIFAKAMQNDSKDADAVIEKVSNYTLENFLFSKEENGVYSPVKSVGLDNLMVPELEENPLLISSFIATFNNSVIAPTQKHQ